MRKLFPALLITLSIVSCKTTTEVKNFGSIEKFDSSLDSIISQGAFIEKLGEGYEWSEGPVWVESEKMLLFSDVPKNTIYKWSEQNGVEVYLTPSGYTGTEPPTSHEPGSNGLTLDQEGSLILAQHGDRRIAKMDAPLTRPRPTFVTIADQYNGKKFNSPNDVIVRSNGDVFFTDPPYGLPEKEDDPAKEIPFEGVYKSTTSGMVTLLVDSLTRPNGIAFFPGEKRFIVANSDPSKAMWISYTLDENDSIVSSQIFADATAQVKAGEKGLPDGLKIDRQGNVFATGPGGVWIFNATGKLVGKIRLNQATANCALADDDKTLYITSHMYLLRIKMR